jgi:hypothetical protein
MPQIFLFLPLADYEEVADGLGITVLPPPQTLLKYIPKRLPMTHLMTNDT